ncbi:hypothetical protein KW797_04240, partial [Candidatus Parcubacteria bacterium]|nr:hypothetical protein [Candidatus Parcubacteria bacterium]
MSFGMTIDQAGLSAGTIGVAREDGKADGSLVTLTAGNDGATTYAFRLLSVPSADVAAVGTLGVTGNPRIWTFTPSSLVYGSYRIELVQDLGLPTEKRQIRTFSIKTPNFALVIPSHNEGAGVSSSLLNAGADQVALSENNSGGSYKGWWRAVESLFLAFDLGRIAAGSIIQGLSFGSPLFLGP